MSNYRTAVIFTIILGISLLLGHPTAVAPDSAEYVAYMVSAIQDGNLYFGDEFAVWQTPRFWNHFVADNPNYVANSIPVGPSLFWMPFYCLGLLMGEDPDVLGMGMMIWIHLATTLYAAILGALAWTLVHRTITSGNSWLSFSVIMLGTPLFYYTFFETVNSHVLSALFIALFIDLWTRYRDSLDGRTWFILGLTGAFAGLTRWQELVVLAVPLGDLIRSPRKIRSWIFYGAGVSIGIIPQIAVWFRLYGSPFLKPQQQVISWLEPDFFTTLFSSHHGLIPWTPVYVLIVSGLLILCYKKPHLGIPIFGFFIAQLYINAAFNPHGGRSFGIRRLTDCTVIACLGYAQLEAVTRRLKSQTIRFLISGSTVIALGWTLLLMVAFRFGVIQGESYVTYREVITAVRTVLWDGLGFGKALVAEGLGATQGGALGVPLAFSVLLIVGLVLGSELRQRRFPWIQPVHPFILVFALAATLILKVIFLPVSPVSDWTEDHRKNFELVNNLKARLTKQPEEMDAWKSLEMAYFGMGNYQRSLEMMDQRFKKALPTVDDLIGRAVCLMYLDRYDEAETQLQEILSADPDHVGTRHTLGQLCQQTGRFEEAKNLFLGLWEEGNRDPKLAAQLAECYNRLRYKHLQLYFQQYVERFGKQ